jgi:hypothetical protein
VYSPLPPTLQDQKPLPDPRRKKYQLDFPPYNGFGTEEDSKTSCNGLEPRPPQRDFYKFMNRDRQGKSNLFSIEKCPDFFTFQRWI